MRARGRPPARTFRNDDPSQFPRRLGRFSSGGCHRRMTRFLKMAVFGFGLICSTEVQAKCVCQCINGRMQSVCSSPGDTVPANSPNDGPYSPSGPTSSTSTAWHVCLYSVGRAPRVPLIEPPPQIFLLFALTTQLVPLWFNSLLAIKPQLFLLWSKSFLAFEPQFFPPLFQPFTSGVDTSLQFSRLILVVSAVARSCAQQPIERPAVRVTVAMKKSSTSCLRYTCDVSAQKLQTVLIHPSYHNLCISRQFRSARA